jgi:hypothetical protein
MSFGMWKHSWGGWLVLACGVFVGAIASMVLVMWLSSLLGCSTAPDPVPTYETEPFGAGAGPRMVNE